MTRSMGESTRRAIVPVAQPREFVIRWRVAAKIAAELIGADEHEAASITGAVLHLQTRLDNGDVRLWLVAEGHTWVLDAGAFGLGADQPGTDRAGAVLVHEGGLVHADLPGVALVTLRDDIVLYARVPAIERLGGGQIQRLDAIMTPR